MRWLLGKKAGAKSLVLSEDACLALFAAADALGLGLVSGVPLYAYVPRLDAEELSRWRRARFSMVQWRNRWGDAAT